MAQFMQMMMMSGMGGGMGNRWGGSGGNMMGMMGMDPEHTALVQRVKKVQKASEGGKAQWEAFVVEKGGGKKDPMLKTSEELKEFLQKADPESLADLPAASGEMSEIMKLSQKVKNGQRSSDEFKQAWWAYCDGKSTKRDPMQHDVESLQTFLASAPAVALPEDDSDHQAKVQQIKAGQRSSPVYKEAWWAYCKENGKTIFDPSKHDSAFLDQFLTTAPELEGGAAKKPKMVEN